MTVVAARARATLTEHSVASLFPSMSDDEYAALVTDIRTYGLHEPIWLHDGQIIDGRHRYRACLEVGIKPRFREWNGVGSLVLFVASLNLKRRHLTSGQRAMVALDIERELSAEAKERQRQSAEITNARLGRSHPERATTVVERIPQPSPEPKARDQAAQATGTNPRYVQDAKRVTEKAPDLAQQVRDADITLPEAKRELSKREREAKRLEPKPVIARGLLPAIIEVADARALPLDDGMIDLTVTSPPYGLDIAYDGGDVAAHDWPSFMAAWLRESLRVTKPRGRLALNIPLDTSLGGARPTYAEAVQAALLSGWLYKATIVWNEGNTTKGNRALGSVDSAARPHPVCPVEMIALFYKGEWGPSSDGDDDIDHDEWQEYGRGIWTFPGVSRAWEDHPAAFPEELPRRLIRYLSRVGDLVLDPFAGSCTTVVQAYLLHRQGIGYDVSERYVESGARRLAAAINS